MTDPTQPLSRMEPILPLLARFLFAAVLLPYYWASAMTKTGAGLLGVFSPSLGAYAQIFPRQMEAAGYDASQLGLLQWAVVVAGTLAEFILPALIVLGLLTRLSALAMIGFVTVQTLTDLYGHGGIAHAETLGAWFDRAPDGLILDQRGLWFLLLMLLVVKGGGALSLDALLFRNAVSAHPADRRPAPAAPRPRRS
ncbi:DoxX family membrane protein [Pseudooceanicola aestuarii]|uniref:DoxX family membrane protein n=1 Tax=Pseudooceanicola aestuarii TaxID=2697319 RepID=UPI0013D07A71|nr:DoxX family membrane protein [Pseudooceanicola aestuarii]